MRRINYWEVSALNINYHKWNVSIHAFQLISVHVGNITVKVVLIVGIRSSSTEVPRVPRAPGPLALFTAYFNHVRSHYLWVGDTSCSSWNQFIPPSVPEMIMNSNVFCNSDDLINFWQSLITNISWTVFLCSCKAMHGPAWTAWYCTNRRASQVEGWSAGLWVSHFSLSTAVNVSLCICYFINATSLLKVSGELLEVRRSWPCVWTKSLIKQKMGYTISPSEGEPYFANWILCSLWTL